MYPLPRAPEDLEPVARREIILKNTVAKTERQIAVELIFAFFKIAGLAHLSDLSIIGFAMGPAIYQRAERPTIAAAYRGTECRSHLRLAFSDPFFQRRGNLL